MTSEYTLIDKNPIIPTIFVKLNQTHSIKTYMINKLFDNVVDRSNDYCKNIYLLYIVDDCVEDIYYFRNSILYKLSIKNNEETIINFQNHNILLDKIKNSYQSANICSEIFKQNRYLNNSKKDKNIEIEEDKNIEIEEDTNIVIEEDTNIVIEEDTNIEDIDINKLERNQLEKMIEELRTNLISEESQAKTIKFDISTMDNRSKIQQEKYNLSKIHNLSNIKNDYKLYKNLVEVNASIPLLYVNIYKHFEFLTKNENIKKILDEIYEMNMDELYINNSTEIEEEIFSFAKNYAIKSKENHLSFEHKWEKIENDEHTNKIINDKFIDGVK